MDIVCNIRPRKYAVIMLICSTMLNVGETSCNYSRASLEVEKRGDTYSCKEGRTWTNAVRLLLKDDMIRVLDKLDRSSGKQYGKITTRCSDDHVTTDYESIVNPDIFHHNITKWCASGCAPLPEDDDTNWTPKYNYQSATTQLTSAPISPIKNYTVTINCRNQFAPQNGNVQTNTGYCKGDGWEPALSNMVTCTSGCKDIRDKIQNGYSNNLRSTALGGSPFNIGDVMTFACNSEYQLVGQQYITCSAIQMWTPTQLPKCTRNSNVVRSANSATSTVYNLYMVMWALVCWSLEKFE